MAPQKKKPSSLEKAALDLLLSRKEFSLRISGRTGLGNRLIAGDEVQIVKAPCSILRSGDLIAIRSESDDLPLVTEFIGPTGDQSESFIARDQSTTTGAGVFKGDCFLGRVVSISRAGTLIDLQADRDPAPIGLIDPEKFTKEEQPYVERENRIRQAGFFFRLNEGFVGGRSEVGDILITTACPVSCDFCLYACTPQGEKISPDLTGRIARGYRDIGVSRLRLLGGEPFMFPRLLSDCLDRILQSWPAADVDIVTSGCWAKSPSKVSEAMAPVLDRGLKKLILSLDAFHLRKIPFDNYRRIVEWAGKHSFQIIVNIHYSDGLKPMIPMLLELGRTHEFTVLLSKIFPIGRASGLSEKELAVSGFEPFKAILIDGGIRTEVLSGSCFRWCASPNGELYFCCMCQKTNLAGDLLRDSFETIVQNTKDAFSSNNRRIAHAFLNNKGPSDGFACFTCPLRVAIS
ncbi:hypothetical protein ACFLU6_04335 [Acidobacteriota bacterium]